MKVNGKMTKPMEKAFTTTMMVQAIMESGFKMFKKVTAFRNGLMVLLTQGIFVYYSRMHRNGLKNGHGKFIWPDLSEYEGEF